MTLLASLLLAHLMNGGCALRWQLLVSIEHTTQQWVGYGPVYYPPDARRLTVCDRAWDGVRWIDTEHDFTTSFDIALVCASKRDHLVLAGLTQGGEMVIESWRNQNERRADRPSPDDPPPPLLFRRTELYRGRALADLRAMGADPEDRFLLLVQGHPARVTRMTLAGSNPLVDLYSGEEIPDLERASALFPLQHATLGRVWTIERFRRGSAYRTLLVDGNDDGVFEWVDPSIPPEVYEAVYPSAGFIDDFVWRP